MRTAFTAPRCTQCTVVSLAWSRQQSTHVWRLARRTSCNCCCPPWLVVVSGQVELLSWRSIKDISGDGGVIKTVVEEGSGWEQCQELYEAKGEARDTWHVARRGTLALYIQQRGQNCWGPSTEHGYVSWLGGKESSPTYTAHIAYACPVRRLGNPRAVSYTARVAGSETPFAQAEEAVFAVADGHLVPGLAVAVKTMKKGEKVHLKLKPQCECRTCNYATGGIKHKIGGGFNGRICVKHLLGSGGPADRRGLGSVRGLFSH